MQARKKDGFNAEKTIVLPEKILQKCVHHAFISNLYITDIGFYPKAAFHYRRREQGSSQNILIYCTDGEGWVLVNKQRVVITGGQYLILPKHTKHIYGASEEKPWSIFWMHFEGTSAEILTNFLRKGMNNIGEAVSYDERRVNIFNNIFDILETGYSDDNLCYVSILAQHYLASFCYPHLFTPQTLTEEHEIDMMIRFMREHVDEHITVEEMARKIYRSPSRFSVLFKRKTGYAPLEYFNYIKMQRACQLLEFTSLHVKEVAYSTGFHDPFYFTRIFTRTMGLSPVQYRKKCRLNSCV